MSLDKLKLMEQLCNDLGIAWEPEAENFKLGDRELLLTEITAELPKCMSDYTRIAELNFGDSIDTKIVDYSAHYEKDFESINSYRQKMSNQYGGLIA